MMIDEVINILKSDNDYNKSIGCDTSYEEQLAEWLEELKAYREIGTVEECKNSILDIQKAYNKAIDDFVKFANTMPTVEEEDGTIRPMWLEEIAEQLKAGGKDEQKRQNN